MKRILLLVATFVLFSGFTLQWDAPTTYTDNTVIPASKTIYYDAWVDNARFLTRGTATSFAIPAPGSGVTHLYEVAAVVDNVSSARAGYTWTSPLEQPLNPVNLRVAP